MPQKGAQRPRLTVIVGAGASVGGSTPSVATLTERIRAMQFPRVIGELRPFRTVVDGTPRTVGSPTFEPSEPAVRLVDRALHTIRDDFNYEHILHAVEVLEPYVAARTMLNELADVRPILTAFTDPTPRYDGLMNWQLLLQLRWDIIRLVRDLVIAGSDLASSRYLRDSESTIRLFRSSFFLHIFNLNYDDLLERSFKWRDGFGSSTAQWSTFDRASYTAALTRNTHVMTHLHGSVRFGYISDESATAGREGQQRQVVKHSTTASATQTLTVPPQPTYTDDIIDDAAPIISGANKVLKFNTPPYSYYYSALQQTLQRSSRILCIGYGFSDPHVNNWIHEAISHHGEDGVRLGIIDFREPAGAWPLERRIRFVEVQRKLSRGRLDLSEVSAREFASSGNICVTLDGYPPRRDIAGRIVEFLLGSKL